MTEPDRKILIWLLLTVLALPVFVLAGYLLLFLGMGEHQWEAVMFPLFVIVRGLVFIPEDVDHYWAAVLITIAGFVPLMYLIGIGLAWAHRRSGFLIRWAFAHGVLILIAAFFVKEKDVSAVGRNGTVHPAGTVARGR